MKLMYKNRYYIAFILSLVLFFAAILLLHSYYNLRSMVQPPSDRWGRSTSLGAEDLFKKKPSIYSNDKYSEILIANKSNFTKVIIDRATRQTATETFNIKGVESYRVQKFDWDENNIYFIESNVLYYAEKNPDGGYSAKIKIADDVRDFERLASKSGVTLAVAKSEEIVIFNAVSKGFEKLGESFKLDKLQNLSGIYDKEGRLHIAAYAEIGAIDFPVYYLIFENGKWETIGNVTERSMSEAWSINDIDIGLDDTDVYIFYEMVKWDKFGQSAKVHYATVPIGAKAVSLQFSRYYIFEQDSKSVNTYLSEPRTLKTQENEIKLTVVRDTYDKKLGSGFTAFLVTMDNGKVTAVEAATRNQRLISNSAYTSNNSDDLYVFLDAAGGFNYEAFYTETGKGYYDNAARTTSEDISIAVMDTLPGYVYSLIISLIKLTYYLPAFIWLLIIEFFEIRSFKNKPTLSYAIGLVLYMAIKLITFGSYYTAQSMSMMPPILNFTGARYIFAFGIAAIAFFIQKLLKKHYPEMHLISEFIVFALIDIEYTNLLYTTYLA